ncbi:MAG: methyltransferase domain-containing protein [Simkania sp.]|nr:methyltransferase domain-containing protein [Simkania sp.]
MRIQICFLLFFVINLFAHDQELNGIDDRIKKQTVSRLGNWCVVPWNEKYCSAEILNLQGEEASVRVFDSSLPVTEWPVVIVRKTDIKQMMVQKHESLESLIKGLKDNSTLRTPQIEEALYKIDRAFFAPRYPYFDTAIDIGREMCISSPHIHVFCLELLKERFKTATTILDVGTGTGFLAAMFAFLAPQAEVIGIEYYEELTELAANNCQVLEAEITKRLHWVTGNGENGYYPQAPYDVIHVGFMCKNIPQKLLDQLKLGGTMIVPVGSQVSSYDSRLLGGKMLLIDKGLDGSIHIFPVFSCSFVPSQVKGSGEE